MDFGEQYVISFILSAPSAMGKISLAKKHPLISRYFFAIALIDRSASR
jgi:hypothetical protein